MIGNMARLRDADAGAGASPAPNGKTAGAGAPPGGNGQYDPSPRASRYPSSYLAALVATGPAIPVVAAALAVFVYAHSRPTGISGALKAIPVVADAWSGAANFFKANPILAGTCIAVALSLLAALVYRSLFTAVDRASTANFGEVHQRIGELRTRLLALDKGRARPLEDDAAVRARQEAGALLRVLDRETRKAGPQWESGVGYLNLLILLHRAEEALIEADHVAAVIGGALDDELRIEGSGMPGEAELLAKLRRGVATLCPPAAMYLHEQPPEIAARLPTSSPGPGAQLQTATADNMSGRLYVPAPATGVASASPNGSKASGCEAEMKQARAVLRGVRHALNDYRDSRRSGLVRMRNRLIGTLALTTFVTYVLLGLAMEAQQKVSPGFGNYLADPIIAVTAFYLVGALVGLFNRLYRESGAAIAVEDYGLSRARLLLTPIVSGLAAVGGVVLTEMVAHAGEGVIGLDRIFNLNNSSDLIAAAVFSLAPGLLVDRLKTMGDQYRTDLEKTGAGQQAGSADSAGKVAAKG
jgi:hypothetical protein